MLVDGPVKQTSAYVSLKTMSGSLRCSTPADFWYILVERSMLDLACEKVGSSPMCTSTESRKCDPCAWYVRSPFMEGLFASFSRTPVAVFHAYKAQSLRGLVVSTRPVVMETWVRVRTDSNPGLGPGTAPGNGNA